MYSNSCLYWLDITLIKLQFSLFISFLYIACVYSRLFSINDDFPDLRRLILFLLLVLKNTLCFLDVNECVKRTDTCGANTNCLNNPGSYACPCNSGYTPNLDVRNSCKGKRKIVFGSIFVLKQNSLFIYIKLWYCRSLNPRTEWNARYILIPIRQF